MNLRKNINITDFLSAVKNCEGDVTFHTSAGDCLNLKSVLSCIVFTSAVLRKADIMKSWIALTKKSDYILLQDYLQTEEAEDSQGNN